MCGAESESCRVDDLAVRSRRTPGCLGLHIRSGQNFGVVTDEEIAEMSIDQRRDLIRRLSLTSEDGMAARRRSVGPREVQIVVTVVSAVILVPWIVYLA